MSLTPDEITRFLAGRHHAVLGINRKHASPHLTPVWYLWNGRTFEISTTRPTQKVVSLQRDPRVSLCIDDPLTGTGTSVVVHGRAEVIDDDIWQTTQEIVERYLGKRFAPKMMARIRTEARVLLRVHPEKWMSWGVYHPLNAGDHDDTCAALCTNFNGLDQGAGCQISHVCWCPDGALSCDTFRVKHPDMSLS
jgi:PPOX class probable F420-dependent enzyme